LFLRILIIPFNTTPSNRTYYRIDYESQDKDHEHTWPGEYLALSVESLTFESGETITYDDFVDDESSLLKSENNNKNEKSGLLQRPHGHSAHMRPHAQPTHPTHAKHEQIKENEILSKENELNFLQRIKLIPIEKKNLPSTFTDFPDGTDDDGDWFAQSPSKL